MIRKFFWIILLPLFGVLAGASAGERKAAIIACLPTDQNLVYDCKIMLTGKKSGKPIKRAEFTVSADMPSMPGVHNIKPTAATPTDVAGRYRVMLHLEMKGEWALRLDFVKPVRDRVVKKLDFGRAMKGMDHSKHMGPGKKTHPSMQRGGDKMKHHHQKH